MPAIVEEVVTLVGELTAFRAVGSDGWGVGTIVVGKDAHRIAGKVFGVGVGSTIEVSGTWQDHERYGRQLKIRKCSAQEPRNAEGVVAWLQSTLPGIGEARARQLVERFGDRL